MRRSATAFSPGLGGTVTITFDLYTNATVTLKLFDEDDGTVATPVRSISQAFTAGTDRSFVWNGTNDAGSLVNEDAYGYALTASYGLGSVTWNPPRPPPLNAPGSGGSVSFFSTVPGPDVFNTFQNDFWQQDANVGPDSARFDLTVTPVGSNSGFQVYDDRVLPVGTHRIVWDGRDLAGQIVTVPVNLRLFTPDERILYSLRRRHSALGYRSPVEYEETVKTT